MKDIQQEQLDILKDMVKLNAIIATELIQLVENSSQQLRGAIPDSCKGQHGELRIRWWKLPRNGMKTVKY